MIEVSKGAAKTAFVQLLQLISYYKKHIYTQNRGMTETAGTGATLCCTLKGVEDPTDTFRRYFYAKLYLVDSTEGRHIDRLPPDGTCTANTGGILTGPAVDDGIDQDLEGILEVKGKKN